MLPEQIWDAADIPEKGMYFGRPSGSAMPLVWAHAEYLKLLRSAHDGRVFDRIAVVEDRYISDRAKHVSKPLVEVWTFMRQAHSVEPGRRLRLLADQPFELVWTADGWASTNHVNSSQAASSGHFADVPTEKSQTGRIEWTFFWPQDHRWEGRNFSAELESPESNVTRLTGLTSKLERMDFIQNGSTRTEVRKRATRSSVIDSVISTRGSTRPGLSQPQFDTSDSI